MGLTDKVTGKVKQATEHVINKIRDAAKGDA